MIRPNPDRDWLLARAEEEANRFVCVGGLAFSLHNSGEPASLHDHVGKLAFSKLISLRRRSLKLTLIQLAEKAKVDLDELVEIENGQDVVPEPRTVCQLAQFLGLPEQKLLYLSGLVGSRDERVEKAAVRFAAQSESLEKLSSNEREALEEFVKLLAEV
jgi:transcriptional regulator with XRE-family HTH domain